MLEEIAARGTTLPMGGERTSLLLNVVARGLLHHFRLDPERIDEEFCADAFALLAGCADVGPRRSRSPKEGPTREPPDLVV